MQFDGLISSIFTLYSSKLEQVISQVKSGHDLTANDQKKSSEAVVTGHLLEYKEQLL
jgi:hypothetical protein